MAKLRSSRLLINFDPHPQNLRVKLPPGESHCFISQKRPPIRAGVETRPKQTNTVRNIKLTCSDQPLSHTSLQEIHSSTCNNVLIPSNINIKSPMPNSTRDTTTDCTLHLPAAPKPSKTSTQRSSARPLPKTMIILQATRVLV